MLSRIRDWWELVLFACGAALVVFAYGIIVGKYQVWPHTALNMAIDAARDWRKNWRENLDLASQYLRPTSRTQGGVVTHDRSLAWSGLTLISGYQPGAYQLWLFDMEGRKLHQWQVPMEEAFPTVPDHLESLSKIAHFHGVAVTPEGDAILNVDGAGTVRLDRCSRVRWVYERFTHHSIDLLPDGSMLIPDLEKVHAARPDRRRIAPGPNGLYLDNGIVHLSSDGEVLRQASLSDLFHRAGRAGLLHGKGSIVPELRVEDPYHLNDIEMLRPELAAAFPMFDAGDLLISLRNLSKIVVLDGATWHPKWSLQGPFFAQHDPEFMPNGRILLYDNDFIGEGKMAGRSRLIEIDPITQQVTWIYDGSDGSPFYAPERGKIQRLRNGNILSLDPEEGRVFEIAPAHGNKVVWEFVNLIRPGEAGLVIDMERVAPESLSFVGQPCA